MKVLLMNGLLLLGLSTSQVAAAAAGGVPSLDNRVRALEIAVTGQGTAGAALQLQVDAVEDDVASLLSRVTALETALALRGPLFAVVDREGTIRASRGVQSAGHTLDSSDNPLTGHYTVVFNRNVSLCAVTVTAEPSFSGSITATINGTLRGLPVSPQDRFTVVLSDEDNDRVDARFNIIVTC